MHRGVRHIAGSGSRCDLEQKKEVRSAIKNIKHLIGPNTASEDCSWLEGFLCSVRDIKALLDDNREWGG